MLVLTLLLNHSFIQLRISHALSKVHDGLTIIHISIIKHVRKNKHIYIHMLFLISKSYKKNKILKFPTDSVAQSVKLLRIMQLSLLQVLAI